MNYLVIQRWTGSQDIAKWTAEGGHHPGGGKERDPWEMFDANDKTYWHASTPADPSVNSGVTISFKKAIVFHKLVITSQQEGITQSRFQGVCLVLNGKSTTCTSMDRKTSSSEKIDFLPADGPRDGVMKVELRFGDNTPVLADLVVFYMPSELYPNGKWFF